MSFEVNAVSDLLNAILQIFSSFCKEFSTRKDSPTETQGARCQDELERLFLWATAVSTPKGYLDETLSRSSALRSSVLLILLELGNAVCNDLLKSLAPSGHFAVNFDAQRREVVSLQGKALALLQEGPQTAQAGGPDSYDDEHLEPGLDDVLDNITTFNDCLMDLSLALERPMIDRDENHLEASDPAETFKVSQPALVYCRKIRDRFPRLPVYLVERLGNANVQRANMLRGPKNLSRAADHDSRFVDSSSVSELIPQSTDLTRVSFSKDSKISRGEIQRQPEAKFGPSSEATFKSFSTSASVVDRSRPRVPPMPHQAEKGHTFKCEYCGQTMKDLITRQQWK